jgi:hypothetical protein
LLLGEKSYWAACQRPVLLIWYFSNTYPNLEVCFPPGELHSLLPPADGLDFGRQVRQHATSSREARGAAQTARA